MYDGWDKGENLLAVCSGWENAKTLAIGFSD